MSTSDFVGCGSELTECGIAFMQLMDVYCMGMVLIGKMRVSKTLRPRFDSESLCQKKCKKVLDFKLKVFYKYFHRDRREAIISDNKTRFSLTCL